VVSQSPSPRYHPEGYWAPSNRERRDERKALLKKYAAEHRNSLTRAEQLLWSKINDGQLGVAVHCQYVLEALYITDFYIREVRLAIEVDGGYHRAGLQPALDADRERVIRAHGNSIIRFANEAVEHDVAYCVGRIQQRVRGLKVINRKTDRRVRF
jgi:very-short-patch-repair endonuclease